MTTGARVDCRDSSGKTPLLLALENGNFKIAEYLIKHGSDVNDIDDLGQSGLHLLPLVDTLTVLESLKFCSNVDT